MYRALVDFTDRTEPTEIYRAGDTYPSKAAKKKPTKTRLEELSGCKNAFNCPMIQLIEGDEDDGQEG